MKQWTSRFAVLATLACATLALACPMCKDSIPNSDAANFQALPGAYNWSVYFFLGGLFFVIGMISLNLVKAVRNTPR